MNPAVEDRTREPACPRAKAPRALSGRQKRQRHPWRRRGRCVSAVSRPLRSRFYLGAEKSVKAPGRIRLTGVYSKGFLISANLPPAVGVTDSVTGAA